MKEDYLWDKSGSDAGIEMLENSLLAFRFQDADVPAIASAVVSVPEKKSFGILRLGFALAFAASMIVVISLIWLRVPNRVLDRPENISELSPGNIRTPIGPADPATPIVNSPAPKYLLYRTKLTSRAAPFKISARKTVAAKQPAKLTAEEKHAYDQLMLALAVTSDELKIVKDKIDGRDERIAADDRQK